MKNNYTLPFGEGELVFSLPAGMEAPVITSSRPPGSSLDTESAIEAALDDPLGSPSLAELVASKDPQQVCLVFTDTTRACPDHLLVSSILARLEAAGVPEKAVTLLCAVGLHRPSTEAEKRAKLGDAVVDRYRIIDHDARARENLVDLGQSTSGIPLAVSRLAYESDLLIATGIVEPHQYAGYSGGAKTVSIGCGGEETIAFTHGPKMLDHPDVRLGRIEDNPFQTAVRQVASQAGLEFVLNVVQDENHDLLKVRAGAPVAVHDDLVAFARQVFETEVPHPYDLVIAGVGAPKDANLYQASRALTYLQLTATPAVRPGGIIILPAPCPEGAGQGVGEQRFWAALRETPDVETMLAEMRTHGYPPGAQRAFVVGQVLAEVEVIVVGAQDEQVVRDCKMIPAETMEVALAVATDKLGSRPATLIVPHALQTLIRIAG